jgi:hypothetical protein
METSREHKHNSICPRCVHIEVREKRKKHEEVNRNCYYDVGRDRGFCAIMGRPIICRPLPKFLSARATLTFFARCVQDGAIKKIVPLLLGSLRKQQQISR